MNKRPPLLGYNHNVRHAGVLFHVQTEDSGLTKPFLTTHAFIGGTILATLRSGYNPDEADPIVQKKMQDQHKLMLKRVRDGEFDKAHELVDEKAGAASSTADAKAVVSTDAVSPARLAASQSGEQARAGTAKDKPSTVDDSSARPRPRDSSELAARLGVTPSSKPGVVPPPPVASPSGSAPVVKQAGSSTMEAEPLPDDDQEPVLEFEADLPDEEEAPAVTIEAEGPTTTETSTTLLSQETPLPVARPLASLRDSYQDSDALASIRPTPVHKVYTGPPRPLVSVLRSRPSAEGVSVQPTLPGMAQRLKEPIRMTSVRINPTAPAPASVAAASANYVPDPDRLLDEAVLTYLGREVRV